MNFYNSRVFSLMLWILFCAFTTTTSAQATPYLIFPANLADQQKLIDLFNRVISKDKYETTTLVGNKIEFAYANLSAAQVSSLKGNTLISGVIPDVKIDTGYGAIEKPVDVPFAPSPASRRSQRERFQDEEERDWIAEAIGNIEHRAAVTQGIINQANAPDELKVFSQPPNTKLSDVKGYSYTSSAGEGISVYVIDSGYYTKNWEYKNMKNPPRWIFVGGEDYEKKQEDLVEIGHGSCCGSKVNGPTYGVAKAASLVIVKVNFYTSTMLEALTEVYKDIIALGLQGKAVINFSHSYTGSLDKLVRKLFRDIMTKFVEADVVFVVASGNDEAGADIDAYPQLLASELPIIVVGAVDNDGKNASFSMGGPLVTAMAPGVGILCASNYFFSGTQRLDGTSFAAPAVAGLAAYLLALGEYPELKVNGSVAKNTRDLIRQMSYARYTGGFPVAYNGYGANCKIPGSKRALGGSCVADTNESAPATGGPAPLFSLKESLTPGQIKCSPTTSWVMKIGTYGFSFTSPGLLVQIADSNQTYYQGMGSGNGSFYADYAGAVTICATNKGSVALDLVWHVYGMSDIGSLVMPALGAKVDYDFGEIVGREEKCFDSGFTAAADRTYTFSYTIGDNTILRISGDSGADYFHGKGSQNPSKRGSMYLTTPEALTICFDNQGFVDDVVSLAIHS